MLVIAVCGFVAGLAARLLDPLLIAIASDFAVSAQIAALLSSAYALPFGLSQPIIGPIGDTFSKGFVIKVAVVVLAVALLSSSLAPNFPVLFASRVMGGIAAGGILPVCMALIGDQFPLADRPRALGRFIGATVTGQLVGASVGGLFASWLGWRGILGVAGALTCLAGGAAIARLPRRTPTALSFTARGAAGRYRQLLANPRALVCYSVVLVEGGTVYGTTPYIGALLRARSAGGTKEAGFVIGGIAIGGILLSVTVPRLLRLTSRPTLMAAGACLGGLGLAGLAIPAPWPVAMLVMILVGFGFLLLHHSLQVEVSDLAPSVRSSAFSLHSFSFFSGQAIGPIAYGVGLARLGPALSFGSGALLLAGAGITASRLLRARVARIDE